MDRTTLLNIHSKLTAPFAPKPAVAVDNVADMWPSPSRALALKASGLFSDVVDLIDDGLNVLGTAGFKLAEPLYHKVAALAARVGRKETSTDEPTS